MRPLRVTLIRSEHESAAKDKIYIDVYVDSEEVPHPELIFLGWMTFGADHYAFKAMKNGQMDFGSAFEHGWTNIRTKKIKKEEYVTFDVNGEHYTYRIIKIEDLSLM